jgi:hypothetical protein
MEVLSMRCLKCDSNWFNGVNCSHCGYVQLSPVIKEKKVVYCSVCGDRITIPVFYGEELRGRKKEKHLCMLCREAKDDKVHDKDFGYTMEDYLKNTNNRVFNKTPICVWEPSY